VAIHSACGIALRQPATKASPGAQKRPESI
jgi:hypothetical protein